MGGVVSERALETFMDVDVDVPFADGELVSSSSSSDEDVEETVYESQLSQSTYHHSFPFNLPTNIPQHFYIPRNDLSQSSDDSDEEDIIMSEQIVPTSTHHHQTHRVFGCSHYKRNCFLQANCCERWYVCRLCHDENEDHAIDRRETKRMRCMRCGLEQDVGQDCASCRTPFGAWEGFDYLISRFARDEGIHISSQLFRFLALQIRGFYDDSSKYRLGRFYCGICRYWNDDEKCSREIFHCDKCGICRVGKREEFFHCDECGACISEELREEHVHIPNILESNCPKCDKYMFTSVEPVIFWSVCQHPIHLRCSREMYDELVRVRNENRAQVMQLRCLTCGQEWV